MKEWHREVPAITGEGLQCRVWKWAVLESLLLIGEWAVLERLLNQRGAALEID